MSGLTPVCAREDAMKKIRSLLSGLAGFYRGNTAGIVGSSIVALVLMMCLAAPALTEFEQFAGQFRQINLAGVFVL